eukprot:21771-Amphidinium_carterae.1
MHRGTATVSECGATQPTTVSPGSIHLITSQPESAILGGPAALPFTERLLILLLLLLIIMIMIIIIIIIIM